MSPYVFFYFYHYYQFLTFKSHSVFGEFKHKCKRKQVTIANYLSRKKHIYNKLIIFGTTLPNSPAKFHYTIHFVN